MDADDPIASREAEWVELFRTTADSYYFELLYKHCWRKVYGISCKLLRNAAEAEDMTHEVFLKAFEKFPTLEGSNFSSWICRIAYRQCLNRIRGDMRRRRFLQRSQPPRDSTPLQDSALIEAREIGLCMEIIASLRPEHRKVLLLKYLEECSYQEISEITGHDSERVRSHLQNAKRNFQIRWQSRMLKGQGR